MKINKNDINMGKDTYSVYSPGYSKTKSAEFYKRFEGVSFKSDNYVMPITPRNTHQLMSILGHELIKEYPVPEMIDPPKGITLLPHQVDMRHDCLKYRRWILAAEMRTMKSLTTLIVIKDFVTQLRKENGSEDCIPVTWVAPVSGVVSVEKELKKWFYSKKRFESLYNIKLTLITYKKWGMVWDLELFSERLKYSEFQSTAKILFKEADLPRVLILDEVHKVKTGKSKIGRVARGFYKTMEEIYDEDFLLLGLSGTPAPRVPTDWHNLIEVVSPGLVPEKNVTYLEQKLAILKQDRNDSGQVFSKVIDWKDDEVDKFNRDYVSRISTTVWKDEVFDLPPKIHDFIKLDISNETKSAIQFIRKVTLGSAQLRNKLRQVSDGFVYKEEIDPDKLTKKNKVLKLPTPKGERLKYDLSLLDEQGIDRVCVFGGYHGTIEQIKDICLGNGWDILIMTGKGWSTESTTGIRGNRAKAVDLLDEFDNSARTKPNGEKIAVIGHPKSMSTGLELSACPVMIYYSHTDDGEAELQSIERAHSNNMNKELGLTIKHYIHLSIDKKVALSIKEKKRLQSITMGDIDKTIFEDLQ